MRRRSTSNSQFPIALRILAQQEIIIKYKINGCQLSKNWYDLICLASPRIASYLTRSIPGADLRQVWIRYSLRHHIHCFLLHLFCVKPLTPQIMHAIHYFTLVDSFFREKNRCEKNWQIDEIFHSDSPTQAFTIQVNLSARRTTGPQLVIKWSKSATFM